MGLCVAHKAQFIWIAQRKTKDAENGYCNLILQHLGKYEFHAWSYRNCKLQICVGSRCNSRWYVHANLDYKLRYIRDWELCLSLQYIHTQGFIYWHLMRRGIQYMLIVFVSPTFFYPSVVQQTIFKAESIQKKTSNNHKITLNTTMFKVSRTCITCISPFRQSVVHIQAIFRQMCLVTPKSIHLKFYKVKRNPCIVSLVSTSPKFHSCCSTTTHCFRHTWDLLSLQLGPMLAFVLEPKW